MGPEFTIECIDLFQHFAELNEVSQQERLRSACCYYGNPIQSKVELGTWLENREFASLEDYAAGFYEFLRECDRKGINSIYVQIASQDGIGTALHDRQQRAAGKKDA